MRRAVFNSFLGFAAGASLLTAFAVSAQELSADKTPAGKDIRTIWAAACSKDRTPMEAFFHINVAPQEGGQWLTQEQVFPAVSGAWTAIAAALTEEELMSEKYGDQSGRIIGEHVEALEKSLGWNGDSGLRRIRDIENIAPMNPFAESAPDCTGPAAPRSPAPGSEKRFSL